MKRTLLMVGLGVGLAMNCATVGQLAFADPTVTLQEVRVLGLGLTGGTLSLILEVGNPNPFALSGVGITTRVSLDETPFGSARWDKGLAVPAQGVGTVEIPLQFTWSGVGAGARALLGSGAIPFEMVGELSVSSAVGDFATTFANQGTVTMLDLVRRD